MPVPHTIARSPHGVFLRSPHGVLDHGPTEPTEPIVGDVLFLTTGFAIPSDEIRADLASLFGAPGVDFRNIFGNPLHGLPPMTPSSFLQYGLIFNNSGGAGGDFFNFIVPGLPGVGWKGRIHWQAMFYHAPSASILSRDFFFDFTSVHGIDVENFRYADSVLTSGNFLIPTGHPLSEGTSGIPLDRGNPTAELVDPRIFASIVGGSGIFTKAGQVMSAENVVGGISYVASFYATSPPGPSGGHPWQIALRRYFKNLYSVPVAS